MMIIEYDEEYDSNRAGNINGESNDDCKGGGGDSDSDSNDSNCDGGGGDGNGKQDRQRASPVNL